MKYSRVVIDSIGYELAPVVVTSDELEERLRPLYEKLHISMGQLEALTGIYERRWWEEGFELSQGAISAAHKAIKNSEVKPEDIGVVIYAGVCRESFEPATACRVAAGLGLNTETVIYDISNACLGVINGIIDIANRIELGAIRAGIVVSCESAREINDVMIDRMLKENDIKLYSSSLATLTGGSGAVAVLLTDGSFSEHDRRKLLGGVALSDPKYYDLCRWHVDAGTSAKYAQFMRTDSVSVLKHGVELGLKTWERFLDKMDWTPDQIDKVICHQVGSGHQDTILKTLGIPTKKDFTTYATLGNIGTVSLLLTAAIAEERGILQDGLRVGFLGIGSGLNCIMLGWEW
ncbi:MAG: 3-oxoacyl-ACP synthase III [Candidatus Anammoxibacter sp.]